MKRIILFTVAALSLSITSCVKNLSYDAAVEDARISKYSIPVETALEFLQQYLEEEVPTKSDVSSTRAIANVQTISLKKTRANGLIPDCDNLVHLVNFEDNQGFAILAADTRISSGLILITENGNLDAISLYAAIDDNSDTRIYYPEYSIDGPGIFYDEDGEMYMNPNTFELNDPETGDAYVGDFVHTLPGRPRPLSASSDFISQMAVAYCFDEIVTFDVGREDQIADNWSSVVTQRSIATIDSTSNLLEDLSSWEQGYPFNVECPIVKQCSDGALKQADVGCVPLAIGKIMVHFKKPATINHEGRTIALDAPMTVVSAAGLLRHLGESCLSLYFYKGTFTFPLLASLYMSAKGYKNVKYSSYDTNKVIDMINNGCPVFICSIPKDKFNYDLNNSHGWNIDGYKKKMVTTTTDYYLNGVYQRTDTESTVFYMVHCDFGWRGYSNGYFTSGIFNLGASDVEFDDLDKVGSKKTNYNWYLKTITYSKP